MILYKRDLVIFFLGFLIVVLNILNVVVSEKQTTKGYELEAIRDQIKHVKLTNSELSAQILEESSYKVMKQKATNEGFREVQDNDYLLLK